MKLSHICSMIVASLFLTGTAAAADFPSKPISIYNAWVPGGIAEMIYRPVGDQMAKILNTNLVLVPSSGAGGLMGVNKALSSKADGYNLLLTTDVSLLSLSNLRNVRWSIEDFIPIGSLGTSSAALIIKKDDPRFATLDEFITYAKSHPGELSCGQSGMLSTEHISSVAVLSALGIKAKLVPFDGSLQVAAAVVSGHVDFMVTDMSYYEGVLPLAAISATRYPSFPELPTLKELGYDVDWGPSYGLFARKGTPPEQIQVLRDALAKAVQVDSVKTTLENMRVNPIFYSGDEWLANMRNRELFIDKIIEKGLITPQKKK